MCYNIENFLRGGSVKKYRDGIFRDYFSDKKRLLDLCNALTGEHGDNPDEIIINTLDGVFFGNLKNDLSCVYKNNFLILIEHQSTPNENMPLRMLFYVAELFKQYIEPFKEKIYRLNQIELPTPKFYLFYNGRKDEPERRQMKLSTAFKNFSELELVVNFYNLNEGKNKDFIQQSKSLNHYCIFVNRIEKNKKSGMDLESAFKEAFEYCQKNDVMADYLSQKKGELVSMYGFEYDDEVAKRVQREEAMEIGYAEGHEAGMAAGLAEGRATGMAEGRATGMAEGHAAGMAEGRAEGHEEGKFEMVKNLLIAKTPLKYIVAATGWSEDKILQLAEK